MLVDPNTGMPAEESMPPAYRQNRPHGLLANISEAQPGFTQVAGWNTFRGSRTILGRAKMAEGTFRGGAFSATLRPKFFSRLPEMTSLGGASVASPETLVLRGSTYRAKGLKYTPYNIAANTGNMLGNMIGKTKDVEYFNRGTVSRVVSSSRIARGASTGNVIPFLEATDKKLLPYFSKLSQAGGGELTAKQSAHALAMSNTGRISGRAAGYMATMSTGDSQAMNYIAKKTGRTAYLEGSQAAVKFMNNIGVERVAATEASKGFFRASTAMGPGILEKFGISAGEKVGLKEIGKVAAQKGGSKIAAKLGLAMASTAVPVVGQVASVLLTASMVADFAQLGMAGVKSGLDFAVDATKSFRGQINKSTMGMGYRDNTVAATSRQRGVMAIQNSRLNARSILGSEAAAMHAHFG